MIPIIWQIQEFEEIDSTNTWLVGQARNGAREGLIARADFQTAGRGRLDRTWEAPQGASLLTSLLLQPTLPADSRFLVSSAVALSARAALVRLSGLRPDLKWPNDLIVNGKKLGGLLAEFVGEREGIVVGIGVNLTWPGPPEVGGTSVLAETGLTVSPRALVDLLLDELEPRRTLLDTEDGRATLLEEHRLALDTLGREVRVERASSSFHGRAVALASDGSLDVATDDGIVNVTIGDVVHVRTVAS
jgi:BirA family biotin operon repressor/biotin-[acetyl-CoA-carboxylase] ligase